MNFQSNFGVAPAGQLLNQQITMFKPPRDLLQEYLSTKSKLDLTRQRQERLNAVESLTLRLLRRVDAHFEMLHHFWVYGLALIASLMVFNPTYGWVNLAVLPVQVVVLGGIIALTELPLMLALALLWGIGSTLTAKLWKAITRPQ